eukprot:Nk52_evm21s249 gene=Nk52_evmTU21s249
MHKVDLPLDQKEAAAILRRRMMEEERKKRIFDSKVRTIGVDLEALKLQEAERKQKEAEEKTRFDYLAQEQIRMDKIGQLLERRYEQEVRKVNKAINEVRLNYQRPEQAKEFDLNNPKFKSVDEPPRNGDDDPKCTLSGMQLFQGEDLSSDNRKRIQQAQLRNWTAQQLEEKAKMKAEELKTERLFHLNASENAKRAAELETAHQQARAEKSRLFAEFNKAQAVAKRKNEQKQKIMEMEQDHTEVMNNILGPTLTEDPNCALSCLGANRVRPDMWKGMGQADIEEIKRIQREQMKEMEERKQQEKMEDRNFALQNEFLRRELDKKEKQSQRELKEKTKRLYADNKALAEMQALTKRYLKAEMYEGAPSEDFHNQFNTTTR